MAGIVKEVTEAAFRSEVLESKEPVLVDFWAPWCGPCRMLAPTLEQIAAKFQGQVTVVKVNVDQNPELAESYRVQGIPALLLFRDGQVVDSIVGLVPAPVIEGKLQAVMAATAINA